MRPIRSFVKRQGRLTPGQQLALQEQLPVFGLNPASGLFDMQAIFQRKAPVAIEIGFGDGRALLQMAQDHPDMNFIGIEVYEPGVGRLLANVASLGLTNVRVVMHDAVEVFEKNIRVQSLERIMVFFPDPWHKKRHHKRRIIQPDFVTLLASRLSDGGVLHLATDWENYAQHMVDVIAQEVSLQNLATETSFVERPSFRPKTKFEERGERLGHGVWDMMYTKRAQ